MTGMVKVNAHMGKCGHVWSCDHVCLCLYVRMGVGTGGVHERKCDIISDHVIILFNQSSDIQHPNAHMGNNPMGNNPMEKTLWAKITLL
mgnify:CR=1 FL=1